MFVSINIESNNIQWKKYDVKATNNWHSILSPDSRII